jgi:hypothetical protein
MITERSIRQDMAEEGYSDEEIEAAVDNFWDSKIDRYEADKEELDGRAWL